MGWGCIPPPAPPILGPGIILTIIPPLFTPSGPVGPLVILGGRILRLGFDVTGMPGRTIVCDGPMPIELVVTPFMDAALFMAPEATTT